jgi:hypothetical protein
MQAERGSAVKLYLFALSLIVISGCSASVDNGDEKYPDDWIVVTSPGNRKAYIVPITAKDGTRCIVLTSNDSGRAISCDWPSK